MTGAPLSSNGPAQVHVGNTTWADVWIVSIIPAMLVLDLVGYFVDQQLGTSPSFLLVGYGLGLCIVLYVAITTRRASRLIDDDTKETSPEG